ncbi:MAG: DUF1572 family protein, partial [Planctomycetes bacterium]|nr:DUF1572 family protein [Planctomycetota bacterium]
MNALLAVRTEFARYRRQVELAIAQVAAADLDRRLDADANSIAILLRHLSGNLRSRFTDFLDSDGEKPWRERDREFEDRRLPVPHVLELWEQGWSVLRATLDSL